jgi:hypothetical protein
MDEKIYIPVCSELDEDDCIDLLGYLEGFEEEFSRALDLKVDDGDCRTTYVDHRITDASLTSDGIDIHYDIDTHTFYGCKDMDSEGTVSRVLTGVSNGTHWVFAPSLHLDPRSTLDEF